MKEVTILGKGNTRQDCPFDTEIWGVNDVFLKPEIDGHHIDKLFAFDLFGYPLDDDYLESMRKVAPIVSWQDYADIHYPIDEVIKEFNSGYFNNSICYMIALAIYQGYERIKIYGCDMPRGTEYIEAKGAIEYWLGRAEDRGIEIILPEGSELLKTANRQIYGKWKDNNITIYRWERFAIKGLLPKAGRLWEVEIAGRLHQILGFAKAEMDKFGIHVQILGDGTASFRCDIEGGTEYDLTERECNVIRDALIKLEEMAKLPVHYIGLYKKFVTERRPEREREE